METKSGPYPEVSAPPPAYSNNPTPQYQAPPPGGAYPPNQYQAPPPGGAYPPTQYQAPPPGQAQAAPAQVVVVERGTGSCPKCRIGYPTEDYTCCGIALAIIFFPLGLICCLMMKDRKCSHCGTPM